MGNCLCCCLKDNMSSVVPSIYDISMRDIHQNLINFSQYQGKVLLIVNTACKWLLTGKNFQQLSMLHNQYRGKGFEVLAFPCNQFFWREFKTPEQIIRYTQRLNINFTVFEKINVNGNNTCELFKYLRKFSQLKGTKIGLNYGKFLIDRNGKVFKYYKPLVDPLSIVQDIDGLL